MVGGQGAQCLAQAAAHRRDTLQLLGRQVVQILVHGVAGVDLVLDAVDARHQHRREGEVWVGRRVGEANFDALGFRARRIRDAAGRRTVARRIGQQHRRLEARDQPLVAVGARVGERVQGFGVLDDAADVVQRHLRQVGVGIAGEHRLAGLPDRLVDVHARTIVAVDRLGHECRRLAVAVGHVVHAVLVDLHVVRLHDQRTEFGTQFMLALRHLVVVLLDREAHFAHGAEHLGTQILLAIHWRHREIAAFDQRAMAHVAFRVVLQAGLRAFDAVQLVHAVSAAGAELHAVEDEELGLRAEEGGVAQAGALQVFLGLLGSAARVAVVALAGAGLVDVAEQDHLRLGREWVHHRRRRIRHQDHVALVDRLPAGDRRAIEHDALGEGIRLQRRDVLRGVMPLAARVGEAEIDVFDAVFLHHLEDLGDGVVTRLLGHDEFLQSASRLKIPAVARRRGARAPGRSPQAGRHETVQVRRRPRRVRRCGCGSLPGCR